MRSLSVLVGLSLTACLIAPAKPSERGDAGGGGGGGGGGGDGDTGTDGGRLGCFGMGAVAGPAVAFDLGSGNEAVFRGGVTATGPVIWRFAPPVTANMCPTDATELSVPPESPTSVDALAIAQGTDTFAGVTMLFATATAGDDAYLFAMPLGSDGKIAEIDRVPATGLAPTPVTTTDGGSDLAQHGTDRPAFIDLVDADQTLWFGGGNALGALLYTGGQPASVAQRATFIGGGGGSAELDAYYGVGESASTDHVVLVGAAGTYAMSAVTADGQPPTADVATTTVHGNCDSHHVCDARIAVRPTQGSGAIVSVERATGTYETIASDNTPTTSTLAAGGPTGGRRVAAVVIDKLAATGVAMAMLWIDDTGNMPPAAPLVQLYDPSDSAPISPGLAVAAAAQSATRMLAVHSTAGTSLLLFSSDPAAGADTCVFVTPDDAQLTTCP